jgi:Nuclease-related domain
MAIRHGLAGQYGKSQAHQRTVVLIGVLCAISGFFGFAIGLVIRSTWGPRSVAIVLGVPTVVLLLLLAFERWGAPHFDRLARERIKYLRGAQGEALVAWLLEDLSNDWHVFNNVKLERLSDIDHIVAGPGGLFCISTKSHRGLFEVRQDLLLYNGKPCDFAQDALRQTMNLKDRLTAVMGGDVPWLQPLLAVPFGFIEGDACGGRVWVLHQEQLMDRICPHDAPKKLDKRQLERVVRALELLQGKAAEVYERPTTPTS